MRTGMIDPVKYPLDRSKCGRASNYAAHRRRGEKPCFKCRVADAARQRAQYKPNGRHQREWTRHCPQCHRFMAKSGHECKKKVSDVPVLQ